MPSTRIHRSNLHTSRIPAPLLTVTARCIPRPVNSLSAARQYIPAAQRARPSTSIASLASSIAAIAISKPVKPTSSLPCVAATCSKLASDRIQARKQRVIANLHASKKRPTAPSPLTKTLVSILKPKEKKKPRVIPPPPANARPSTVVSSWMPSTSPDPTLEPRGDQPYCECRPCFLDSNGKRLHTEYAPLDNFGIGCTCHSAAGIIPTRYWIEPRKWRTTPAEADVDPTRPRIVRFANNPVRSMKIVDRWWGTIWPKCEKSEDQTTEAEDDAAVQAMDNPAAVSSGFHNNWQSMLDQYFPDDDE